MRNLNSVNAILWLAILIGFVLAVQPVQSATPDTVSVVRMENPPQGLSGVQITTEDRGDKNPYTRFKTTWILNGLAADVDVFVIYDDTPMVENQHERVRLIGQGDSILVQICTSNVTSRFYQIYPTKTISKYTDGDEVGEGDSKYHFRWNSKHKTLDISSDNTYGYWDDAKQDYVPKTIKESVAISARCLPSTYK